MRSSASSSRALRALLAGALGLLACGVRPQNLRPLPQGNAAPAPGIPAPPSVERQEPAGRAAPARDPFPAAAPDAGS